MTPEEILQNLYDETMVGNGPAVIELTNTGLEMGMDPETLLFDALIPSLEEVGARFERGDWFVPEMLIAGKAMVGIRMASCGRNHSPNACRRSAMPRNSSA